MPTLVRISGLLAIALAALALVACGGDDDEASSSDDVTVELAEFDGSGQSGTATLSADGDQTRVVISIDSPISDSQPAHIHEGTCDNLTAEPAYGLPNVANGTSESTVDVTLDSLTGGAYAINLHMSDKDLATYTSCGNIE
jgi:Cu/Zn superoxide dismutase